MQPFPASFREAVRERILCVEEAGDRAPLRAIMESINQADEYRHLEELYAEMSDEQIEDMSGKMEDLTNIAQQVLRAEISRRGLGPQGLDPPEDPREVARRALRAEISEDGSNAEGQDGTTQSDPYLQTFPKGLDPEGFTTLLAFGSWVTPLKLARS